MSWFHKLVAVCCIQSCIVLLLLWTNIGNIQINRLRSFDEGRETRPLSLAPSFTNLLGVAERSETRPLPSSPLLTNAQSVNEWRQSTPLPSNISSFTEEVKDDFKYILTWNNYFTSWNWPVPSDINLSFCAYRCYFTKDRSLLSKSSVVMFHIPFSYFNNMPKTTSRPKNQLWVFMSQETPVHGHILGQGGLNEHLKTRGAGLRRLDNVFNLSMTYMSKSDIHLPYGMSRLRIEEDVEEHQEDWRDMSRRTNHALWIASNCGIPGTQGLERLKWMKAFANTTKLRVNMYGRCGVETPCGRKRGCSVSLMKTHKFYMALENAHCDEYITEKFWNALASGVVPVVDGPSLRYYQQVAPPHSFIHVKQFKDIHQLARYLEYLDKNNAAYLEYLQWKEKYVIRGYEWNRPSPRSLAWCKVCEYAHHPPETSTIYDDLQSWWGFNHCRTSGYDV